jgi:two-component system sensor histidine kinase BaeS
MQVSVFAAALGVALVGLVVAYYLSTFLSLHQRVTHTNSQLTSVLRATEHAILSPNPIDELSLLELADPSVDITVDSGGRQLFQGIHRPLHGPLLQESARVHHMVIHLSTALETSSSRSLEVTAIAGALALLVIAGGLLTSTYLSKTLRQPIDEVVEASERIASGDLSARISSTGPEEFTKLAVAFDLMAQHLEEAETTKRRFLSDLAHEIATPLNSIAGFALAISDGTITDAEEQRDASSIIRSETNRIRSLLQDLRDLDTLDLSKPTTAIPLDLPQYLATLVARLSPQLIEKEVEISVVADPILALVDPRLVDLVMSNLLTNAVRYVSTKGTILLFARKDRNDLILGVRDNGVGIAPEHLGLIFDRLYRVDTGRDRRSGGSGLGLSIAQRAAQNLGGRLEVSSTPGEGSEFRLILQAPRRKDLGRRPQVSDI